MPKIAANGQPSYSGHEGIVENAHGEKFQIDPTQNLDGSTVGETGATDLVQEPIADSREVHLKEEVERDEEKEDDAEETQDLKPAPAKKTTAAKKY